MIGQIATRLPVRAQAETLAPMALAQFQHSARWLDLPDAFATPGWIDHCAALAVDMQRPRPLRAIYRAAVRGGDFPSYLTMPYRRLQSGSSVLDIGGGFGDNFLPIAKSLPHLDWCVVDNERSAELGRSVAPDARFADTIPDQRFDLALLIGSLQYVQDWRDLLGAIAAHGRPAIYMARTPLRQSGDSFTAVQSIVPAMGHWAGKQIGRASLNVIGVEALNDAMRGLGYRLAQSRFRCDYSKPFSAFLARYRNVAYIDMMWEPA
jgi:putative methyltransferase (TIGR04325 family)